MIYEQRVIEKQSFQTKFCGTGFLSTLAELTWLVPMSRTGGALKLVMETFEKAYLQSLSPLGSRIGLLIGFACSLGPCGNFNSGIEVNQVIVGGVSIKKNIRGNDRL